MVNDIYITSEKKMQKSMDSLRLEFTKMRSGRAHPSLLEHLQVDYYGSNVPLSQVASIVVSDARTLTVTPWEKSMIGVIDKAIMQSGLGLNPATAGQIIRVPLPPLTEERRKEMVKILRHEAENTRISIRNVRRDANSSTKELAKEKIISEDAQHQAEERMQKLTDQYISKVDLMLLDKEKDLMTV